MKIHIDADACPVTKIAVKIGKQAGIPVAIYCDDAHVFQSDWAEVITVSRGNDAADFALVRALKPHDIAITQDYGVAAMALAKAARALDQNGREYTDFNLMGLLGARHESRKIRRSGGRTRGPKKRTASQDEAFRSALLNMIKTA